MKKIAVLCAVVSVVSMHNVLQPSVVHKKRSVFIGDELKAARYTSQLKQFSSQYFASVVLSGCIGAITGECVRWLEKQLKFESSPIALFLYLLSWSMESEFRNEVIMVLQKDLDAYNISHRKNLMFKMAQITSWMMYLREYVK